MKMKNLRKIMCKLIFSSIRIKCKMKIIHRKEVKEKKIKYQTIIGNSKMEVIVFKKKKIKLKFLKNSLKNLKMPRQREM